MESDPCDGDSSRAHAAETGTLSVQLNSATPSRVRPRTLGSQLVFGTAWIAALAALTGGALSQDTTSSDDAWLPQLVGMLCGLAALGACMRAASRFDGRQRRMWFCVAAACGLWTVPQILLMLGAQPYLALGHTVAGWPVVAGAWIGFAWFASALMHVAALFLVAARARDLHLNIRRLCLLGILIVCGYAIVAFPIHELIVRPDLAIQNATVLIGYMTLESAGAIFAIASLVAHGSSIAHHAAPLLIVGALLCGVAFVLQGIETLNGAAANHPAVMPFWAAGFACTFFAALRKAPDAQDAVAEATEGRAQDAMRVRAVEIALPIIAVIAVAVSRLLTREPIDTEEAALIIVPTLFGIVLMFSIGEWCDRATNRRRRGPHAGTDGLASANPGVF